MAEYIDREAAANIFEAPMWRGYSEPYTFEAHLAMVAVAKLIREEIGKIPAADVAPVVHGRWRWVAYDANPKIGNWHCTYCNRIPKSFQKEEFCPNCGAKMDEEPK